MECEEQKKQRKKQQIAAEMLRVYTFSGDSVFETLLRRYLAVHSDVRRSYRRHANLI